LYEICHFVPTLDSHLQPSCWIKKTRRIEMTKIFRMNMLPARQGDCLWIEYGDLQSPQRLLIDGGTPETVNALQERICQLPVDKRQFELLVITHIDSDHIGGMLALLDQNLPGLVFGDIWFNGWRHLPGSGFEEFGPVQGEVLTSWLDALDRPWNEHFGRKTVYVPDKGLPPFKDLSGGMRITLLSPGKNELSNLRPKWEEECNKAGIDPAKPPHLLPPPPPGFEGMGVVNIDALAKSHFKQDTSVANGSSIAILAEFDGHRILLAGDAYSPILLKNIKRLAVAEGSERLRLDAFKLPHHGSKANLSKELLEKIECQRYLFSTDGTQFKHPDRETAARVIKFGGPHPELLFNYRSEFNKLWDNTHWMEQYGYSVSYPDKEQKGLLVNL
jgi:beta-lactamase superfamily II metal-dependent hydrolase